MRHAFYNGQIYTGGLTFQEAFLVEDGMFADVGSSQYILSQNHDAKTDLEGCFVCPGFNDSHMHLLSLGRVLTVAPLASHTSSLEEMIDCLRKTPPGQGGWILGRGWNQDLFSDYSRMPNRFDLDRVSTDHPVCAIRACGHALCLNSRGLEEIGITAHSLQPEGGEIGFTSGEPNGLLFDAAMDYALKCLPLPEKDTLKDLIRMACGALNAQGITSCQSDDYSAFQGLSWEIVNEAFEELEKSGELTVRICEQANLPELRLLEAFLEKGYNTGTGNDFFRIGPLKLLGDGALGARTAYLSQPYADAPASRGLCIFSQKEFDDLIGLAHKNGMQTAIHCIGDACLDMVLNAIEKALATHPRPDHRHGIVHCQITRPDQLEKMAALNLHIYAQSIFLDYDIHIVEARCGNHLAESSYSWKTLLDTGCSVSNGSDCPVEYPNVLGGIQCAVTRRDLKGFGPYLPHEAFSIREALDSFTAAGAYASFEENRKGQIAPGMLADFTVLGENPFRINPNKLNTIPVLSTWVGGKLVFSRQIADS